MCDHVLNCIMQIFVILNTMLYLVFVIKVTMKIVFYNLQFKLYFQLCRKYCCCKTKISNRCVFLGFVAKFYLSFPVTTCSVMCAYSYCMSGAWGGDMLLCIYVERGWLLDLKFAYGEASHNEKFRGVSHIKVTGVIVRNFEIVNTARCGCGWYFHP